ncbi:DUF4249 domain-containing protein [Algoriphagus zhangzhouensis]|uniref:DUF4249 domain-containing protein n=1 Tax=Algoriphagus zhangzhouensis TaxID=1073327 RepID=A0A1M7Z916_9BACT|nr:DUF4249 domain-containing protein [Algoriphagus zhangzhouensis]TDY47478.1 uncharacterized protein DUF4249 [Algoriphagus zhangzhouensis]SHO61421.1 protein of unknown function [Algoriphagus zhangzhouensis]
MRKIILSLLYVGIFLGLGACVDPYEVEIESGAQLLTVDGMITTDPGRHSIKLTRSDTYGSVFEGLIRPVSLATVLVRNQDGVVTYLTEDSEVKGNYLTPEGFAAKAGDTYTLQIQLQDGKTYTSLPETVGNPVPMGNIDYYSVEFPVEGELEPESGVRFVVDVEDPSDENNFYYWRTENAMFEVNARPDLYMDRETRAPAPKDCCFTCYLAESVGNRSMFIATDDDFNGLSTKVTAMFIPDDGLRFITTFRMDLRQLTISASAYRFLRLVKQQTELSGSVFDPPPANIRGNMISLDDPDEVVLGYFMVAGETNERMYIHGADLDYRQPLSLIADDCRVVVGAEENPPSDWNP